MVLYILSAVGLPFLAITFFTVLESAFSNAGIWDVLSNAGLDLCRVSLGIVGAMFLDVQVHAAGTIAAVVLMIELVLAASAMLVEKRATSLGIVKQSSKAFGILFFGIISMVIPAMLIVLNRGH
jgi:hypothetical protein